MNGAPSAMERSFNMASTDQLQALIAWMFCSSGLSLHLARNPHFIGAFTCAANNLLLGNVTP